MIKIGNEVIPKSQVEIIAQKVLKNCNFLQYKNENNQTRLKSGSGKTMITSGLSIEDFAKKFNIPK